MDWLTALILGIVEGVSELLPISSTGHLILASQLMGLGHTEFLKSFEIAIQVGAILSVVALYWRRLLVDFETMKKLVVAFLPTGILGLTLYRVIKTFLLGSPNVVLWSLFLGGIFIIAFEYLHREREDAVEDVSGITYRQALLIGLFQSVAMIPGVSRSAATIIGGLALGLRGRPSSSFPFSWRFPPCWPPQPTISSRAAPPSPWIRWGSWPQASSHRSSWPFSASSFSSRSSRPTPSSPSASTGSPSSPSGC